MLNILEQCAKGLLVVAGMLLVIYLVVEAVRTDELR